MLQLHQPHPAGRFARCRSCGAEPRHIVNKGRTSREPVQFGKVTTLHLLECRCGARTSRRETLAQAELQWGSDYAQLTLPLRISRRRRAAA